MVLNDIIEVGLKGNERIPYYRELGIEIPTRIDRYGRECIDYSKKIYVKLEDMPEYSEAKVTIKCDYQEDGCRDVYQKNVGDYIKSVKKSVVKKDSCSNRKCQTKKTAESNMVRYGFEYHMSQPEFHEKVWETNLLKYGNKTIMGSEYFKNKTLEIVNERYGVYNISQLTDVKIKKAETYYRNSSVATSRQQQYLHNLFGGELNYANNTPSLDIAFPDEKIYIEFNGSGHDLCVKMGQMTRERFESKERSRYYYLKKLGWKGIFIDSPCDYLPSDNVLLNEFEKAKEWFLINEKGHSHYTVIIGNKINDERYGKLRRIADKDLHELVV